MNASTLVCSSGLAEVPAPSGTDLEGFLVSVVRRHVQGRGAGLLQCAGVRNGADRAAAFLQTHGVTDYHWIRIQGGFLRATPPTLLAGCSAALIARTHCPLPVVQEGSLNSIACMLVQHQRHNTDAMCTG